MPIAHDKNDPIILNLLTSVIDVDDQGVVTNRLTGHVYKTHVSPSGYARIRITTKARRYQLLIHRIVLCKFVGSKPMECDHINFDRMDNRLCNLRYATRSENCVGKKTSAGFRLLTELDIANMRLQYRLGASKGELARAYRVSHATIDKRLAQDYKPSPRRRHWFKPETIRTWAARNGINYHTAISRLHRGLDPRTGKRPLAEAA